MAPGTSGGALLSPARVTQAFSSLGPAAGSGGPRSPSATITVTTSSAAGEPVAAPAAPYTGAATAVQRPLTSAHTPKTPSPSRAAASPAAAGSLWSSGPAAGSGVGGGGSVGGGMARRVQYDSGAPNGAGAGETQLNYQPPLPPRGGSSTGPRPATGTSARGASGAGVSSTNPSPRNRAGSGANSASLTPRDSAGGGGSASSFALAGNVALAMGRARSALASRATSNKRLSVGGGQGSLSSMGSQVTVAGGIGGAAGTAGGIDVGRLIAIQKLLDEFSDDDVDASGSSPGGGGPFGGGYGGGGGGMRFSDASGAGIPLVDRGSRPSSAGYHPRASDGSGGGGGNGGGGSGLRGLAALRDKGDMHMWMPAVSTVKGSLEEHAQRLRERADVTQSLRKWADQVVEEAASHSPGRLRDVTASALQPADATGAGAGAHGAGLGEEDADQADIDEERRLAAVLAARPDGAGLGAQLRAHFNNVVADEVARKFEAMRASWNEEVSVEMDELKELREAHKELRSRFQDAKEALDKANTKMEMMRRQMGPAGAAAMAGLTGASSPTVRSSAASPEPHSHHGGVHVHHSPDSAHGHGHGGGHGHSHTGEDPLHDRVANIGSRRGTPLASHAGEGALFSNTELQTQLRKQAEQLAVGAARLQEAELTLIKTKQDKARLEQELAAAKVAAAKASAGGGAKGAPGSKSSGGGKSGGVKAGGGSAADKAAADKADNLLQAEVDKLGKEVATVKLEASTKGREAAERAVELEKVKKELTGAQDTLSAALQQLSALREERDKEHRRAEAAEAAAADARATAMAEAQAAARAVEEAAASTAARASAASAEAAAEAGEGGAVAAAAEAMSGALQELGRQRDEAARAAGEWEALAGSLQQQVADLQQELQQQYQRQPSAAQSSRAEGSWASGSGGGGADNDDGGEEDTEPTPAPAAPTAEGATASRAVVAMSDGGVQTTPRLSQLPRPELASCSVQTSARGTPRKQESAGYSARGGGEAAAPAVATLTAATSALVLELQRRLPTVLQQVLGGADADTAAEEMSMSGGAGAAGAGAAEAASAAVEVVRSELLRCLAGLAISGGSDVGEGANVLVLNTVEPTSASGAASARALAGPTALVPTLDLSALAPGQQPATRKAPLDAGGAAAAVQAAAGVASETAAAGMSTPGAATAASRGGFAPSSARVVVAAGGSGTSSARGAAPTAVVVDGVTFVPLGFKGGAATGRLAQGIMLPGGHGLTPQQQLPPKYQYQPHQQQQLGTSVAPPISTIPIHDARSAAVAGPTAASLAEAGHMTATLPGPRGSFVVASAARRRKSAFASLHSNYLVSPNPNAVASDGEGAAGASEDDGMVAAAEPQGSQPHAAAGSGAASVRVLRSAGAAAGAGAGAGTGDGLVYSHVQQHGAAAVYVDPALAAALQVGPISPAAARAAGAGPGALVVDGAATGPSPWDHGLGSSSQQNMLLRRPKSAAARALESARQQLAATAMAQQQAAYGGGGGFAGGLSRLPRRPASAALQPFGVSGVGTLQQQQQMQVLQGQVQVLQAQMQGWVADASGLQPMPGGAEGASAAMARDGSPQRASVSFMLAEAGAKVRSIAATPQKGIQLPGRLRSAPTRSQALASAGGRVGGGGATEGFPDEPVAPQAAVTGNAMPGPGHSPGFRELQLHVGRDAAVATHFAPPLLESGLGGAGGDGGGSGSPRHSGLYSQPSGSELPANAAELAALARELMFAQERAAAQLEAAQSTQRELADEVAMSRRQWVDEAKRARDLEAELARVRGQLLSMGVGEPHRPPA